MSAINTSKTPPPLSAQDRSSFAYKTIKDRLPVIIVKTIDFLHRHRKDLHTFGGTLKEPSDNEITEIEADAKEVITRLAALRKDLETNKSLQLLENSEGLSDKFQYFNDDIKDWNISLVDHKLDDGSMPRYFDSPWLLVECYLYRSIKNALLSTKHLKMFDPFAEQKQAACRASVAPMLILSNHMKQIEKSIQESAQHCLSSERTEFGLFLQMALWANKSDLSISGMSADKIQSQSLSVNIRDSLEELQENILCDNLSEVWFKVQSIKESVQKRIKKRTPESTGQPTDDPIVIDLVADNAGYEVFVDLLLIHFLGLMLTGSAEPQPELRFRIHLKRMPWFVSDCLRADIDWLLDFMSNSKEEALQHAAERWRLFLKSGFWEIHDDKFWTLPHDYSQMHSVAPDLHAKLAKSSLIVFKGDLNYRKLTGDRRWHLLTPFRVALRGFGPAPLVTLRTAKADVVVGIEDVNIYARINNNELPRDWMISGNFGLIQYMDPL